ncbi:MAG: hypothetical protein CMN28_08445 [Salinisphaeraceae bacterium]|jgi:uncharacterized protein YcfJ|nr:hypothetical protein [Salinisphaeraceae bacterium]
MHARHLEESDMRRIIATTFLGATLASPMALAGPDMDPIFNVTPIAGQPAQNCFETAGQDRNIVTRGATSTAGQTIIGGVLGAAVGNRFGDGSGRDIATGVGAAAGAAAGAWNANRMEQARIRECQQGASYANNGGGNYGAGSSADYGQTYGSGGYDGRNPGYGSTLTSGSSGGGYVTDYQGR